MNDTLQLQSRAQTLETPILPAQQEIRLITNEPAYLPMLLFAELRNLQIDMETIQLSERLIWKSLANVSLRLDKTTDMVTMHIMRQAGVTLFGVLLPYKLDRYPLHMGKTRLLLDFSSQFKLSCSIEYSGKMR
ncbi:hypothetical protein ASPBRDRAFT_669478 [Aspergillus brasiliensis CBS 101740]|uniref:Uncharacterized protein n=1 Tax=Aspergillus brasiliensis (strain CBS 101740 / IMI 381727 / IBT 21946) TaxID=767769 RepID=A0A1L9U271_ASPBC|nr:hypothetical protein ASPBRDRAFT_669478 [Aspergillus brasiliensis CBS 101740]